MSRSKSTTAAAPEATATAPASTAETENRTTLVGRLCADPILRQTRSGKPVATIRIAVNDGPEPTFHSVVAWGRTAEVVSQYLRKGRLVEVTGRSQERTWQHADGTERRTTEVVAYRIQFLNGRGTSPAAAEAQS